MRACSGCTLPRTLELRRSDKSDACRSFVSLFGAATSLIISQCRQYDVARPDVMSIRGHGPWANFLRGYRPGYTGQWPCLRRVRSLIVFASSTVQWPKLPGYTCLRRATSSRKENCVGTCPLGSKKKKNAAYDKRRAGSRCTSNVKIDCKV